MSRDGDSDMTFDERMSAAVDNELSARECRELLDELESDAEKRDAWVRHHRIAASLRGESLAPTIESSWEQLYAKAQSDEPKRSQPVSLISFESLRNLSWFNWVGGAALAASVLLGVSLFVVVLQPGFEDKGQYALEPEYPIPTIADITPRDATSSQRPVPQFVSTPQNQRPQFSNTKAIKEDDFQLASGLEESTDEDEVVEASQRRVPVQAPRSNPNRQDLVRWASDRK